MLNHPEIRINLVIYLLLFIAFLVKCLKILVASFIGWRNNPTCAECCLAIVQPAAKLTGVATDRTAMNVRRQQLVLSAISSRELQSADDERIGLDVVEKDIEKALLESCSTANGNNMAVREDPDGHETQQDPDIHETQENPDVQKTRKDHDIHETPENPDIHETLEDHDVYETPKKPDVHETSASPDVHETPENSDVHETPEDRDVHETSENLDIHETPENPDIHEVPKKTDVHETQI